MTDALEDRTGLPDALKVLLAQHPREGWRAHPEFGPLTQFWLERHLGFRRVLDALQGDLRARIGGDLDPREHGRRLSRLGGILLNELHGHHSIEDHVYFPKMIPLAPGLERGFEILDADHHRLHEELDAFAEAANAVLRDAADGAPRMAEGLERMARFLDRHLTDEEDLVVPVILKVGEGRLG
ncbi:hemerythrin domain-containing protein [Jannaschia ovalis]|uniref:Hemerythrin domain-containing protein n=1 Tax=Jannaschia ovalis TaxID=3038773 RepID=A0ABY8LFT1_9RHOB|nr:hemerythrin domain-containing protein [Jannaschia sp. GRR-S6-38]WGH80155.1 hemerythrin domain-containing protein [Jannaschia sp. GRR-S6-38]